MFFDALTLTFKEAGISGVAPRGTPPIENDLPKQNKQKKIKKIKNKRGAGI